MVVPFCSTSKHFNNHPFSNLFTPADAERIKRRRVDREKKFFEAETHRLKTLLTVSTGGKWTFLDVCAIVYISKEKKKNNLSMQERNDLI